MIDPDADVIDGSSPRPGARLRMMTIAPERPGALDAIRQLRSAGVIAAIGHTDATFEQAGAAIAAGATVATHLGNAMSPLHHRDPVSSGRAWPRSEISCELIVDGHHLHPAFVRHAAASKGAGGDRADHRCDRGGRRRRRALSPRPPRRRRPRRDGDAGRGRVARRQHADDGRAPIRNAVAAGLDEVAASRAASANPARLLGIDDEVGTIEAGKRADLVVLDEAVDVVAVIAAGEVVSGSLDAP